MMIRPGLFLTSTIGTGEGISSLAVRLLGSETDGVALDFTDLTALVRDTASPANNFSGNVNSWLTYTSPSTKWILGSNGLYSSGTTLRTEYNASGTALGVRIEPAATNLCLRSRAFATAPWSATSLTASNTAVGVDGVANAASLLTAAAASSPHNVAQSITWTAAVYTVSLILTYTNNSYFQILTWDGTTVRYANFDILAGTAGTVSGMTAAIRSLGGGRYVVSATSTTNMAAAGGNISLCLSNSASAGANPSFNATGVETVIADMAQVETGTVATSPIVTAGSTVTRAADLINKSGTGYPSMNAGGTILAAYRLQQTSAAGRILQLYNSGGGVTDHTDMYFLSNSLEGFADGGNVTTTGTKTLTAGIVQKSAHRFTNGSQSISLNGAISHADTRAMTTTFDRLILGYTASALQQMNGHMQYAVILPRQLSNAEINAGTTL